MASVDQVRAELNLTAPTHQTLRYLRADLGLEPHDECEAKPRPAETRQVPQTKGALRTRPPVRATTKRRRKLAPAVQVHETTVPQRVELSQSDRKKTATEAFNLTLRHLGEAVKALKGNDGSVASHESLPRPPQPDPSLQERSPNKRSKRATTPTKDDRQSTRPPDLVLVVECCHSALQCLRKYDPEATGSGDCKTTGPERGALVLLDRSISLGLTAHAISQLSEVQLLSRRCHTSEIFPLVPSLEELLLGRPDAVDNDSGLDFIASMQKQALRLALLVGHKCITPGLVRSLRAETPGSPAWIIIQGLRKGRMTPEQAGQQLRTLALVLDKLYVLGIKSTADSQAQTNLFDLFCVSLHIKFESWVKAGLAPEPVADVWRPYHRALKKLSGTTNDLSNCPKRVLNSLILFRDLLVAAKCKPDIPQELAETILDALQSSDEHAELLATVEDSLTTAVRSGHVVQCQIAMARLKTYSGNLTKTLITLNSMERTLSEEKVVSQAELSQFLPRLAQLRKQAVALLPDRATAQISDQTVIPQDLEISLISLLHALFVFLKRHVSLALRPATEPSQESNRRAFLHTFAKTIDAVLYTDHCAVIQGPELMQTAWETLKDCSVAVQELQARHCPASVQSSERTLCNQLRIKVSQRFWSRYLAAVKQHRPLLEQADILELSLQGVLELPESDQRTAHTALKFETLAYSYLEARNFEMALHALRNALAIGIRQGILNNIVESLLSTPFRGAWGEDSRRKAFGKVLTTYARTLHAHPLLDGAEDSFYDDHCLPPFHRAALVEQQMLTVFELEEDDRQISSCTKMMKALFNLLDRREYHVYMLRSVSRILAIGLRRRTRASMSLADSAHILALVNRELPAKETVFENTFEPEIRSLLRLQHGFLTGRFHYQEFKHAFKHLSDLARSLKTLDQSQVIYEILDSYVAPLLLTVDYADINEDITSAIKALETLEHLATLGIDNPALCLMDILVRKSNMYLQQREVESMETSLAMANKAFGGDLMEPLTELEFSLAYSELHLQLFRLEDCLCWLLRAQSAWERRVVSTRLSSTKSKLKEQGLLCRAAYVASRLAYLRHQLLEAIVLARQSAKIAASIWSSIDNLGVPAVPPESTSLAESEIQRHNLSVEFSKLDISCEPFSRLTSSTISTAPYITLCFVVFSHMASLSSHCGIYQEAATFHEQALKVARKTSQSTHEAIALSGLSVLHARAGQVSKAREVLSELCQMKLRSTTRYLRALTLVNQGEAYLALGDLTKAHQQLIEAKQHGTININNNENAIVGQIRRGKPTRSIAKSSTRPRPTKTLEEKHRKDLNTSSTSSPAPTWEQTDLEARISALEAKLHLLGGITTISCHASECDGTGSGPRWIPVALGLVHSAMKLLSEDAVHSVLAETAVALPVRYRSARNSGRVSFVQPATPQALVSTKGRTTKQKLENDALKNGNVLLVQAYDILQKLSEAQASQLSSDLIHTCHKILTKISLLSTALNQPLIPSSLNLVLDITRPLELARLREDSVTLGELMASRRTSTQEWPSADGISHIGRFSNLEIVKEVDMDIVPASWSIVCVELSEDKNELFVARLTRETSPFVVRIPLSRPDLSDADVDELSLESAKAEMRDIIVKANATAHDARGSSVHKPTRAGWLAERQALDIQLSTLLDSIENTWFGGFRGLLSAPRRNQNKLSVFGRRLHLTLNSHLPSRQRTSLAGNSTVHLHDHVLELFVGLGHPQEADLEDAVTDLLYFVIDILQFNGERNAYDEIDFDAMLIEVLDAMHAYHDASLVPEEKDDHVILVLDKELQVFPWESLPCLRGQAVSRMPSLGSIWKQLRHMREQSHDLDTYLIPTTNGAYILNPSSDLKSTQETFGELFDEQLPDYNTIINRHPTAQEFENVLKEQDLVLYFGHGGGGQYIRPRTIRKMDKCAVTLLMGCSSAKLTECGDYEPYGMPLSYLSGGSPAIVGTLWDVTDRDIDRFALELMENWGLLNASDDSMAQAAMRAGQDKVSKGKGTTGRAYGRRKRGPVSLDQAVAGAREACLLKYLNGAAPVMYGVPVILN